MATKKVLTPITDVGPSQPIPTAAGAVTRNQQGAPAALNFTPPPPQAAMGYTNPYDTLKSTYVNPYDTLRSGSPSSVFGFPSANGGVGTTTDPTNPAPQTGVNSPFGAVPGPIGLPNPSGDLSAQYPNLTGTNAALSSDIYNKLSGYLSPSTLNSIQNHFGGEFGVRSGMPGSNLSWNNVYGNIIGASENQRQQGIQDYNSTIPTVSGTQTVTPAVQAMIAEINSINRAAPSPTVAQSYAKNLFDSYLKQMRGPGGGTGGSPFGGPAGGTDTGSGALGFGFGKFGGGAGQGPLGAGFGSLGPSSPSYAGSSSGDSMSGFDPTQDLSNWGSDLVPQVANDASDPSYWDFSGGF